MSIWRLLEARRIVGGIDFVVKDIVVNIVGYCIVYFVSVSRIDVGVGLR